MKKIFKNAGLAAVFAVSALCATQSAVAGPLSLSNGDKIVLGYGNGANGDAWGGGEFLVTGVAGQVANGPGDSFFTFCLEYSEHFTPGNTYTVQINNGAVNGGLTNAGTYTYGAYTDPNGTTNYDPLSRATAWLYTQFTTNAGSLGYDMTGGKNQASSVNQSLNDAFQLAIWKLEGELSGGVLTAYNSNTTAQNWVNAAIVGSSTWTDIGNVRAMNLTDTAGNHQDQLYYVTPVPEPLSLSLLGLGLVGLGFAKRRKQQAA